VSDLQDLIHSTVMKAVALGVETERNRIIELFNADDSACSGWAVGLIEGKDGG
jgi:hypothetical protein